MSRGLPPPLRAIPQVPGKGKGEPQFCVIMAGFISDLLVGLPVPDDEDVGNEHITSMFRGLHAALSRLNDELEFVQNLRIARDKIDDIEKKLKDSAALEEEVLRRQKKNNEAIIEHSLRLEEYEGKFKGVEDKLNAATYASRKE